MANLEGCDAFCMHVFEFSKIDVSFVFYFQNACHLHRLRQNIAEKRHKHTLQRRFFAFFSVAFSLSLLERSVAREARLSRLRSLFDNWQIGARALIVQRVIVARRRTRTLAHCFGFWQRASAHVIENESIGVNLAQLHQRHLMKQCLAQWQLRYAKCAQLNQVYSCCSYLFYAFT
jgi:hypothetical protein